jgi:4-hydroxy-3-methylbut-2-en-1-yl diphosphate reductase
MMRIILANPRGFCAGVNMAINVVDEALRRVGPPIYVYHEIVHNRHVVDDFKSRGVSFVDSVEEVPEGSVVVFSAHGVSPAVREAARARRLREIDATCPLVTKVHSEVIRFARDGYKIVFVGHRNHDEAVGTVGEAPEAITVVESVEEVERLEFGQDVKLAYVTQTTLSLHDAERIIAALRKRYPGVRQPPKEDICYATTNRQNAVTELAIEADLVLVVGSQNSSNSKRLVETAEAKGVRAYLVDDASELGRSWFTPPVRRVLVTAGASAPEHLVDGVVNRVREWFGAEVEERTLVEEDVEFAPPKSLRSLEVIR